ncbi:putative GTPase effector domain-containing protein [Helianthus anomalus]
MKIVSEVLGGGRIEKMLNEPPSTSNKRERLQNSIALLKESKETMEQVMDGVVVSSD